VEGCLQRIAAGEAPRLLRLAWEQHRGVMCRGVSWDRHTLEELQQVAECVGGRGLAAVMRLLATDHAGWSGEVAAEGGACGCCLCQHPAAVLSSRLPDYLVKTGSMLMCHTCLAGPPATPAGGMPDLLLWRPAKRDAKLAEVKGPRDRLSSQQTAWMHALNDAGLRAEVLKVVEPSQAGKRARRK
jgi:Fanconi-associated nuclease 1